MPVYLVDELKVFQSIEKELIASHPGKYVLIKDQKTVGTYDSQSNAISEGYSRFGNAPFFIKQIAAQ